MVDLNPWGWCVVDKPEGYTSMAITRRVKRQFKGEKAGHAGTLDPLATGILPVAVGKATRLITFLMNQGKSYTFTVCWSHFTTTDDILGEPLGYSSSRPTYAQIVEILPQFTGTILQTPPIYSAVKLRGKPAYTFARDGISIEMAAKSIHIDSLSFLGGIPHGSYEQTIVSPETLLETGHLPLEESKFLVTCGSGTYVRSLAREMAKTMGLCGHVKSLRRTHEGPFQRGITLQELEEGSFTLLPPQTVLHHLPSYSLTSEEYHHLWQGKSLPCALESDAIACYDEDQLVAIAKCQQGRLYPIHCLKELTNEIYPS